MSSSMDDLVTAANPTHPSYLDDEALRAKVRELDYIDYPTAWAIQFAGLTHLDARCSAVEGSHGGMGGPAFLCDCGAVEARWAELRGQS